MAFVVLFKKFPSSIMTRAASSRLAKLWQLFSEKLEEIKSVQSSMRILRSINDAEGKILDYIGGIVGELRDGREDSEYRLFIKIAIAKNNCSGSIPEILEIARAISAGQSFAFNELYEIPDEFFWDANGYFDAQRPLSPGSRRERAFELEFTGDLQTLQVPKNLPKAVDQIRAGGIFAKVHAVFNAAASIVINPTRALAADYTMTAQPSPTPTHSEVGVYEGIPLNDVGQLGLMDGQDMWDALAFFSGTTGVAPTAYLTITEAEA